MSSTVVLTGGGVKSAVAAACALADHDILFLHVDYGQPAASAQARALALLAAQWPKTRLCSVTVPPIKLVPSATRVGLAAGSKQPAGRQADDGARSLSIRSMLPVMLSFGAQAALQFAANSLTVGVSEFANGDHYGLPGPQAGPDARHEVFHSFDIMLEAVLQPDRRIRVEMPLMDLTYSQIIKLGQRLKVPFERTYTCEIQAAEPCRQCAACKARSDAFLEAGVADPATTFAQSVRVPASVG